MASRIIKVGSSSLATASTRSPTLTTMGTKPTRFRCSPKAAPSDLSGSAIRIFLAINKRMRPRGGGRTGLMFGVWVESGFPTHDLAARSGDGTRRVNGLLVAVASVFKVDFRDLGQLDDNGHVHVAVVVGKRPDGIRPGGEFDLGRRFVSVGVVIFHPLQQLAARVINAIAGMGVVVTPFTPLALLRG